MGIRSFNKGMDDIYLGRSLENTNDPDYWEGVSYAEDIERDAEKRAREEEMYKKELDEEYEEYIKSQKEKEEKESI